MSKRRDSAADDLWKEKADLHASAADVMLTILLALALVGALCIINI